MKPVFIALILLVSSLANANPIANQVECFLDVKDQMFDFKVTDIQPAILVLKASGGSYSARLLEDATSYSLEVNNGNGPQVVRTGMLSEFSKKNYSYVLYFKNLNGDDEADIRCSLK